MRRPLTPRQQLRKLQLAVNHIAAVIDDAPGECLGDLDEALGLIHQAENAIEDGQDETDLLMRLAAANPGYLFRADCDPVALGNLIAIGCANVGGPRVWKARP